jgi:hypothetical protein
MSTQPSNEADLLRQINRDISPDVLSRYNELFGKRQAETLTPAEYTELLTLTNQVEQREAERVSALAELAKLRQISLSELMTALSIQGSISSK